MALVYCQLDLLDYIKHTRLDHTLVHIAGEKVGTTVQEREARREAFSQIFTSVIYQLNKPTTPVTILLYTSY